MLKDTAVYSADDMGTWLGLDGQLSLHLVLRPPMISRTVQTIEYRENYINAVVVFVVVVSSSDY